MSSLLFQIAQRVMNVPLMIMPEKLAVIAAVLEGRINIDASEFKELAAGSEDDRPKPQGSRYVGDFAPVDANNPRSGRKPYRTTQEGVAIIPVHGSLVNRGGFLDAMSGITSYEKIKYQIDAAAKDGDVTSILLDIDSGGGEAVGAFEAGDAVRLATPSKRVVAVANGLCCSAAYAIASGASRIVSSKSSVVGSIGTALLHLDRSKQLSDAGIKPTLFVTGKRKGDGSPFFELSDEVKGELRSYINRVNSNFLNLVSGHRSVSTDQLVALEAGVFIGAEAIAHGLVDEVGSFETVLSELHGAPRSLKRKGSTAMTDTKTYTQAELDAAIATARTEAAGAANADRAAAIAAARTEATTAERERIKAITSMEEAKGRGASALHLAVSSEMSADAVKGILAGLPVDAVAAAGRAGGSSLGLAVDPPKQGDRQEASTSWDAALSKRGMKLA